MRSSLPSASALIRDTLVLAALLAGLNAWLDAGDPGWSELNPSPWLALPLVLGLRYGLVPGVTTGLLSAVGIGLWIAQHAEHSLPRVFDDQGYLLVCIVLAGLVGGEAHRRLGGRGKQLNEENHRLAADVDRLRAEVDLGHEYRSRLQRQLTLWQAPLAGLDEALRQSVSLEEEAFGPHLLQMLYQSCQVVSSAIYRVEGQRLVRWCSLHPVAALPEQLEVGASPLLEEALEKEVMTAAAMTTDESSEDPLLAVIPLALPNERRAVVILADMPWEAFHWGNLSVAETLVTWCGRLRGHVASLLAGRSSRGEVRPEVFRQLLKEALDLEARHQVTSTALRLETTTPGGPALRPMRRRLVQDLPAHAVWTHLPADRGYAVLCVATPGSQTAPLTLAVAEEPDWRAASFVVSEAATLDHLTEQLLEA